MVRTVNSSALEKDAKGGADKTIIHGFRHKGRY